jgi:hypothetical protein
MYKREYWKDHVVDQNNEVIQQGTLQDQAHFNNIETGIDDVSIATQILMFKSILNDYEQKEEIHVVSLDMNSGQSWPFNNKDTIVALSILRENTNYSVDIDVLDYSGGRLGNIRVSDRALNGFKLVHDGSATTVRVKVKISGGMDKPDGSSFAAIVNE